MATLTNRKVSQTYKDLLQVSNSNSGIDATLRAVEDGEGTSSILQLSSAAVNITGAGTLQYGGTAITATAAELNILDGATVTVAELNVLDGYTGSVTELNYLDTLHATGVTATEFDFLDGVTSNIQTQLDSKVTGFRTVEVDTNGDDSANETLGASETLRFKKGSNITLSESGGVITIASTDTNTQLSNAQVRAAVEAATDSNVFTDADHTKLGGIETSATADQTDSEIRTAVENASDSNVFTDADHTKLNNIEANADVTDTANVRAADALMDDEVSNLSFVKGLTKGISDGNVLTANDAVADNDFLRIDGTEVEGLTAAQVRSAINVEDGATADQSAAEILTAIKTVDGSTSGLDSDLLDGQHGSHYLDFGNFVIDNDEIPIAKLASDNVSYGGVTVTLGASDATPAFDLSDATSLPIVAGTSGTLSVARGGTGATSLNDLITLGTHTTGNYVAGIAGTSNEITVSGSGSESASVTISLPDDVTIGRDLVVTRNLTVSGTTTTINTDEINIADNQIVLNSDFTGSNPTESAGIEVERGTQTNKSLQWNESDDKWTVGSETFVAGTFEGNLTGTVNTATQGTIDHDSLANFVANEHKNHATIDITAGAGLTGGGNIAATRTLAVGAGSGIAVNANDVAVDIAGTTLNNSPATGDLVLTSDSSDSDAIKAVSISDIVALAPQGDITSVSISAGTGLSGGGSANTGALSTSLALDFSELTDMTGDISGSTEFILQNGTTESRKAASEITLSAFNNDSNFTSNAGTVTSVTAGTGMTQSGTNTVNPTLNVIAGTGLTANANDVEVDIQGTSLGSEVATGDLVLYADISDSNNVKSMDVGSIVALAPQGDITAVVAGTNLSGGGNGPGSVTLNVDDAFLVNDANDTTTGTITAAGFTTAGNLTLGGHAVNDIDLGGEFNDVDDHLMTSAAINDRILSFGYTTNTGDITAVVAGTGLSGGNTSGSATLNLDINGLTLASEAATGDTVAIYDTSATAVRKVPLSDVIALASSGDITGVTAGAGLTGGGSSGGVSLAVGAGNLIDVQANQVDVDLSELTDGTADIVGSEDELVYLDDGAQKRKLVSEIKLSQFNNDSGFTSNAGDITNVVAGSGLSGGNTSGTATLNVDIQGTQLAAEIATNDLVLIADTSNSNAIRSIQVSDIAGLAPQGDITSVVAGTGLTGGGSSSDVTLNVAAGNLIDVQANQVDVDLSELTTSTSDGDGDFFAVIDASNNQKKLTKGNINISGFNNDSGFTSNTGDITAVVAGDGLSGGSNSGSATVSLDITGQTLLNESPANDDEFIVYDTSASAFKKVVASDVVGSSGDITAVVAGSGLTGGSNSGSATLNVGAGTLIDVSSTAVSVDLSELTTSTSNADGDHFVVVDDSNAQKKLTKGNINISGFNNDSGFTTNTGDITAVVAGDGMTGGATSGSATVNVVGGTGITANANDIEISIDDVTLTNSVTTSDTLLIYDASASAVKQASIADFPFSNNNGDITGVTAGSGLTGGGNSGGVTLNHEDTSSQSSVNNSGRTYIQDITLDTFGHVTAISSATETVTNTDTNTNQLTTFQVEDGDGTEVTISQGKELKFREGGGIDINFTDTSTGSDGDPFDLTFTVSSQTDNNFTNADHSKLDGIEAGATADQSASEIRTLVGNASDSNVFTDADHSKLDGIASGATANTGDITNVSAGVGLSGGGSSGSVTLTLDMSELTDMTASVNSSQDELIILDNGADRRKLISEIPLSAFNNDSGFTTTNGDITGVTAGTGLSGGGTSGTVTVSLGNHSGDLITSGTVAAARIADLPASKITSGTIPSARLDSDTAHLSGTQTFSGAKTFSNMASFAMDGNTISGIDDSGEFTDNDSHIMTSAAVNDRIQAFGFTTNTGTVDTSGSPVDNDFAKFTDSNTIEGRSASETRSDLGLGDLATADDIAASKIVSGTIADARIAASSITQHTDSKYLRSNATDTASGVITFSNTTNSTSKTTGAVKISGGLGVAKTLNAGEDVVAFASSDKRLKDNLKPIENSLDKVSKLSGYEFDWNDKQETYQGKDVGVVAQEVEEVMPEIVTTRDNGYKAVKYEKIVPLLIEAIKELKEEIEELKK